MMSSGANGIFGMMPFYWDTPRTVLQPPLSFRAWYISRKEFVMGTLLSKMSPMISVGVLIAYANVIGDCCLQIAAYRGSHGEPPKNGKSVR